MTTTDTTLPPRLEQQLRQLPADLIALLDELATAMAARTINGADVDATARGERVPDSAPHVDLLHRFLRAQP